jgi:PAS domain-containing protein
MQQQRRTKDLLLILARDLAANVSTPTYLVDAEGTLVYFNEAAEALLGQTFQSAGELSAEDMIKRWRPEDPDGTPLAPERIPIVAAVREKRPVHGLLGFTGSDGVRRVIQATAMPLLGAEQRLAGAVAYFWEETR